MAIQPPAMTHMLVPGTFTMPVKRPSSAHPAQPHRWIRAGQPWLQARDLSPADRLKPPGPNCGEDPGSHFVQPQALRRVGTLGIYTARAWPFLHPPLHGCRPARHGPARRPSAPQHRRARPGRLFAIRARTRGPSAPTAPLCAHVNTRLVRAVSCQSRLSQSSGAAEDT